MDSRAVLAGRLVQGCRLHMEVGWTGRNAESWGLSLPRASGTGRLKMAWQGRDSGRSRDAGRSGQGPWERREAPNPARPPVCELHVHPDCVPFACSDCRQCHQDGHRDHVSEQGWRPGWGAWGVRARLSQRTAPPQDTHHHHWREGNLPSSARCEVCRKACCSTEVLSGLRCEWCGIQVGRGGALGAGRAPPFCRSSSVSCSFGVGIPIVQKRVGAPPGRGSRGLGRVGAVSAAGPALPRPEAPGSKPCSPGPLGLLRVARPRVHFWAPAHHDPAPRVRTPAVPQL